MKHRIMVAVVVILLLVVAAVTTKKSIAEEMFPMAVPWRDISPYGELPVDYFEYKDKYCFVAHTKYVATLQCGKL